MSQYLQVLNQLERNLAAAGLQEHEIYSVMAPVMDLTADYDVAYELNRIRVELVEKQRECLALASVALAYGKLTAEAHRMTSLPTQG